MTEQIHTIRVYKANDVWQFDDDQLKIKAEPLVRGMENIIENACRLADVQNPEQGFLAHFSSEPFPGNRFVLQRIRSEDDWTLYSFQEGDVSLEGWLCPVLTVQYFDEAPPILCLQVEPLSRVRLWQPDK